METVTRHATNAPADAIIVPDAQLLFNGEFKRAGVDLIVSKGDHELLLHDYFRGEKRATLASPDGAHLTGDIVSALTGHTQFAQAGASANVGKVIGHVSKLVGTATAIRNGVSIILNNGDNVEKGDVVQSGSGSTLGITFIDGTVFGLSSNARMVLNEMVYDPNGSNNSSLLSLVAGTISFVAGETAKHGDMKVDTPVATMGIRGTAVLVEIDFDVPLAVPNPNAPPSPGAPPNPGASLLPNAKFHVLVEPDGTTGSYILYDKTTFAPLATVNQAGQQIGISQGVLSITTAPLSPEVQKLITDVFSIKFTDNVNPKIQFALGTSGNNLADLGNALKAPGDDAFDLKMPGIGKGTNSSASLVDSAAEMLFFLHEASNGSSLVENSVAGNLTLSATGNVIFTGVSGALGATFALKSSTSSADLPGFTDNVSQIGTFAVSEITSDLNINTSVAWGFTIPDSDAVLQSLAMGQILTQIYTITLSNGASQDVTVTLVGTNDIPTIVSSINDALVFTGDSVLANHDLSAGGTITFRDVDLIDTHHAVVALKSSTSSAHLPGFTDNLSQIGKFALLSGPSGVSEISTDTGNVASVDWSFTLADNDPVLQSLAKGQTITQVYTVTIIDNNGAAVARDVTVTLVGTNDTPTITTEDVVGAVTEMVTPSGNLSDSGIISFADLDLIDVHLFSAAGTPVGTTLGTLAVVKNADTTGTGSGGQLTWTYTVADSAIANLGAGQTKVESFTITLDDQNGGVITKQIDVTITGSNDVPVIGGVSIGSVTEDVSVSSGKLSTSGALTIVDVDAGQSNFAIQGGTLGNHQHGTFTLTANGQWTYTADNSDAAIQQLGAGQSITDSFIAVSSDGSNSQTVTVTIHGTNDVPVIGGVFTGNVKEDNGAAGIVIGNLTASGTLTINDADQNESFFAAQAGMAGAYGTFTLDSAGHWTYSADNAQLAIQQLGAYKSVTDSFNAVSFDGTASQLVTVTIYGTNDVPVIGGVHVGAVSQDVSVVAGKISTGGVLTISDVDAGEAKFAIQGSTAGNNHYGTFTLDADGHWTYSADNAQLAIQQLGANDYITDFFTAVSSDGTASQLVTVTIRGANDVPVIGGVSIGSVTEDKDVNAGKLSMSGALTIIDLDQDQSNFTAQAAIAGSNGYGTFTLAANGAWTYSASNSQIAVQQLGAGQSITDSFTAVSSDGSNSQLVTVTIHGTNDVPLIGGVSTGSVTEDLGISGGKLSTSGALSIIDVDHGQSAFVAQAATAGSHGFGIFTLDSAGHWTYTADNTQLAIQQLGGDKSITDSFTAVSSDGTASQPITVTIYGSNDVPVIGGKFIGSVTEDNGVSDGKLSTGGALTIADLDQGQSAFVKQATAGSNGYGTFALAADGQWTYTAYNSDTAIQHLGAGQSITDSFTAVSFDGSNSQLVTVTIHGTNDEPVIGGANLGSVTEDVNLSGGNLSTSGALTISDADQGQSTFAAQAGTAGSNGYGSFTLTSDGSWTYSADNAQLAIQQLGGKKSITDSFTAVSSDGTASQLVTVTIHGTNDNATIGGNSTAALKEDGPLKAGGTLTVADIDTGEDHFRTAASLTGNYGTFTFDANTGVWGYTVNNGVAESLATGQVVQDSLTVTSADGSASRGIVVSITGTNDAPVIYGGVHSKVSELAANGGQAVSDGRVFFGENDFTVSDPDGPQFGIAINSVDKANGTWEYHLASDPKDTWTAITLDGQALLLSANDSVRFNGAANAPIETMTFRAWDGSKGKAGDLITILASDIGGSGAFSEGTYFAATKNNGPAGIAGEPINLGLADASLDGHSVTVTISDLPSDWHINGGTHNADGSWSVQTTDVASLTVTTAASFTGAVLLSVTETMVQADGTTTTFSLGDNLEAYAAGAPIFAWSSGDDFLTASSGKDLLVFSQPIGHDTIYSFDAGNDQIDLIGYADFAGFADVQSHLSEDAAGNAVVTLGAGQTITLQGVDEAALTDINFVFDQSPVLTNSGTLTIGDGAMLPLTGTIHNSGVIALDSSGDETELQLIEHGVTLDGGGRIVLSDSDENIISGASSGVSLNNVDNTISGAGQIGDGELRLTNAGTIDASGSHVLAIDTGSNIVINSGVLEASGSGGLNVASSIANSGVLWANGSSVVVQGDVSGNGIARIDGAGVLDFEASATANVAFGSGAAGTLKLGDSFHFSGTISGFTGGDTIDLADLAPAAASISYLENAAGTGGTLMVSDGSQTLELSFLGHYSSDNFSIVADHAKGTLLTYVPHDLIV